NNSSGTHSLIHGKTIDHVLELRIALADGSIVQLQPFQEAELEAKCQQTGLEAEGYRTLARLAAQHAEEIDKRYPKILRRVGGYNFDRLSAFGNRLSARRSESTHDSAVGSVLSALRSPLPNLAHLFVGSEGTLGITLEAKLRLIPSPKAKAILV